MTREMDEDNVFWLRPRREVCPDRLEYRWPSCGFVVQVAGGDLRRV
jgi:hypothetical protein